MDKTSPYDECNITNTFTCKDFSGFNSMKSIILDGNGALHLLISGIFKSPELPKSLDIMKG